MICAFMKGQQGKIVEECEAHELAWLCGSWYLRVAGQSLTLRGCHSTTGCKDT